MKRQIQLMVAVLVTAIAILTTVFSVSAAPNLAGRSVAAPVGAEDAALAKCTQMKASEVIWVTLDENGDIGDQVKSYPAGTIEITPYFEYNCIPKKMTLVMAYSYNGEAVFTDKATLKATNSKGFYAYTLGTTDNSPMEAGEWGVQFLNNKTLLAKGTVMVGEGGETDGGVSDTVKVQGTVTDKKTKKPVSKAVVAVLMPGVTVKDWVDGGQKDKDVFTMGQSDSKGKFVLAKPLTRNTEYSLIVAAKGYKAVAADGFVIGNDEADPVNLDVALSK